MGIVSGFQTLIQYVGNIQQTLSNVAVSLNKIATKITSGINFRFPGVFTNTQMNPGIDVLVNGIDPTTFYQLTHPGNYITSAVIGGITVPSTSTVYEADAIVGYISTASTATAAIGGSFYALNGATGTTSYALNPLVSDQGFVSTVVGAEYDIGCSNVGSTAYGSNMIGVFTAGTPATAIAYQVSVLNAPWQWSFVSYDGCTVQFALIGALGTTANSDGQPIQFNVRDAANVVRIAGIQAQHLAAGCNLIFTTPTGAAVFPKPPIINAGSLGVGAFLPAGLVSSQFNGSGIGNGADTTDDPLFSYVLPANSFDANGRNLVIEAWGDLSGTGNNKTIKLWFGSQVVVTSGVVTFTGPGWYFRATITRDGTTNQTGIGTAMIGNTFSEVSPVFFGTQAMTAGITIMVTGASPTTGAANDVVGYGMTVEFRN